ncbi:MULTISPECIES: AraD1 family protein [Rhizobium/Agrobacterium group]|uniref:AraD1 family protein n=2 Tax=Neorhizobium TaxID=1525371 RepID=A0ABV0M3F8_9HYPH|nr:MULTISPECIES: AraD1 family protein [Rhizobium/Agrobacterium group]KGE00897.1 FAH family protein [Rhizobium sp. YS-1r]MCC2610513.1 FAH family protein [Neorhizobium petrolearium]WGI71181.1 GguC family protein [Neorhizobium petrolearium]
MLRVLQVRNGAGQLQVVAWEGEGPARVVTGVSSTYELAMQAIAAGQTLSQRIDAVGLGETIDLKRAADEGRLALPITHPDPAHFVVAGTGLTHLGSADGRDKMHKAAQSAEKPTDSMRMFLMGVEGGKPGPGQVGVQPEWFYKGNGSQLRATGEELVSPSFALDGGEEPELAAIYLIGPDGTPFRLGFCLANEFSDHVTEKGNYLWLAHSKLRQAALGPELLVGDLPDHVEGTSRVRRGDRVIFEKPFLSGEANMSHTIANLEYHNFKYELFRQPGDLHVHFFGTATLSFSEGVKTEAGDIFEISAAPFKLPLVNRLTVAADKPVTVKKL